MSRSSWVDVGGYGGLQVLWEDGERVFCRGKSHADGDPTAALVVLPAAEHPTPVTLDRLAREYGLKDELDGAWAVRPLELVRERGRIMLVLEDTCGEPLDRLLGLPMEVRSFLRLAIAVAAALSQVHRRDLVHKEFLRFDSDPRSPERGQYGFVQGVICEVALAMLSRRDRSASSLAGAVV